MPAGPRSWWNARDEEVERFTDNVVPRAAIAWPWDHQVEHAAAEVATPGDPAFVSEIADHARRDPDGAFERIEQMQRRMEG